MINLDSITLKDINQRMESVDPKVREVMESELFTDRISEISDFYNFDLSDRENLAFHKLVAVTILGFIKPEELPEAILTLIETDEETAQSAAEEVRKVIAPLTQDNPTQTPPPVAEAPQAQQTEQQQPEQAPQPPSTPAQTPSPVAETPPAQAEPQPQTQPAQQAPQKKEQTQQPHLTKAPFVIHEDVEVKPGTEQNIEEQNPTRPIFYKPSFNGDSQPKPAPTKVKVDLGNKESLNPQAAPKRKDYTIHTPKETTEEETGPVSNEEVHPENIVDLKDIPK